MSKDEEAKDSKPPWMEDVEELKAVLGAVSDFLQSLMEPVKGLIDATTSALEGGKLGREIAEFYSSLKESGMPEEMIRDLTREFFREKLKAIPNISNLANLIGDYLKYGPPGVVTGGAEGKDEYSTVVEILSRIAKERPELKKELDKTISLIRSLKREKEEEEEGEE